MFESKLINLWLPTWLPESEIADVRDRAPPSGHRAESLVFRDFRKRADFGERSKITLAVWGSGLLYEAPKTNESERKLALPPTLLRALIEHDPWQTGEGMLAGTEWHEDLVLAQPNGRPINNKADYDACKAFTDDLAEATDTYDIRRGDRAMSDVLISDVPDDVLSAIDARAARLGLSRTQYLRRRLAQDAVADTVPVTAEDLRSISATPSRPRHRLPSASR